MAEITVIGAGYVGLVTAAGLAELEHNVTCVEINAARIAMLERNQLPIYEPGLDRLVARHRMSGHLRFTSDYATSVPQAEFVFVAVGTPPTPAGAADTRYVFAAVRSVLQYAQPGTVIVVKSTVPVGTGDAIAELVRSHGMETVSNPEFLREGTAVRDFLEPDRIVIGASHPSLAASVARLYASLAAPVVSCARRSAELAKYAANAFLATRISFINEMSVICDQVDADIEEVARVIGMDQRIGPAFLNAGLGWGGSCFPKDLMALADIAASNGAEALITSAVAEVNRRQRHRAVDRLVKGVAHVPRPQVGVLGLAFKPHTDDIREAPALDIIARLQARGVSVRAHDPLAAANAHGLLPEVEYDENPYDVARGSHALLLATEWPDYLTLNWRRMHTLMAGDLILDGRNVLDAQYLTSLGFIYASFGRATGSEPEEVWTDLAEDAS